MHIPPITFDNLIEVHRKAGCESCWLTKSDDVWVGKQVLHFDISVTVKYGMSYIAMCPDADTI